MKQMPFFFLANFIETLFKCLQSTVSQFSTLPEPTGALEWRDGCCVFSQRAPSTLPTLSPQPRSLPVFFPSFCLSHAKTCERPQRLADAADHPRCSLIRSSQVPSQRASPASGNSTVESSPSRCASVISCSDVPRPACRKWIMLQFKFILTLTFSFFLFCLFSLMG